MNKQDRCIATYKMEKLMNKIYNQIKNIEVNENRRILLKEDVVHYEERFMVNRKFDMLYEPFLFADTFGFTVYSNSISEDEVLDIFERVNMN